MTPTGQYPKESHFRQYGGSSFRHISEIAYELVKDARHFREVRKKPDGCR